MNEECLSLMENNTWDLVPLPKGRKLLICKCMYRNKYALDGSNVERHKDRLVSKGLSQVEGIICNETFSPISKMNSIFHFHKVFYRSEVFQTSIYVRSSRSCH
jgi:hypothetical protein